MTDDDGPSCRNCDKPIDRGDYCGRICEGMDRHTAPREGLAVAERDIDRCPDCQGTGSLPIPGDDGYPRRCYHHNAPANTNNNPTNK